VRCRHHINSVVKSLKFNLIQNTDVSFEEQVNWLLTNPLTLLAAGAAVSGWLIPRFTRKWQDHQVELDMKVKLVSGLSDSVTKLILAIQYAEDPNTTQEELPKMNDAKREWHQGCSSVGSRIETYFYRSKNNTIEGKWIKLALLMENLYFLPGTKNDERNEILDQVKKSMEDADKELIKDSQNESLIGEIDWKILRKGPISGKYRLYFHQWLNLANTIHEMKHKLIQEIVESKIAGFLK
jgi:hypothetical protein